MSEFTLDVMDKLSGFAKVFSQKSLELWPKDGANAIMAMFVLGPSIVNRFVKKKAINEIRLELMAPTISKWSLYCWQKW